MLQNETTEFGRREMSSETLANRLGARIILPLGDRNIVWSDNFVSRRERESRNKHKGYIIWLTGLSGSGKTTIAQNLERTLFDSGLNTMVLDGDNIRCGLNSDLGFSSRDREENIRRIGETARLFMQTGFIAIAAFISPYQSDRERVRNLVPDSDFIEVFLDCPLEVCEKRDVKGLYKKARAGLIKEFTGVDAPYERPKDPEIYINTGELNVEESVDRIVSFLKDEGYL